MNRCPKFLRSITLEPKNYVEKSGICHSSYSLHLGRSTTRESSTMLKNDRNNLGSQSISRSSQSILLASDCIQLRYTHCSSSHRFPRWLRPHGFHSTKRTAADCTSGPLSSHVLQWGAHALHVPPCTTYPSCQVPAGICIKLGHKPLGCKHMHIVMQVWPIYTHMIIYVSTCTCVFVHMYWIVILIYIWLTSQRSYSLNHSISIHPRHVP